MVVLVCYVPDSHLEAVKEALFSAGAGKMDGYDRCCWQVRGTGQFRPLAGSNPFLGTAGELEQTDEWRIELVVDEEYVASAVEAMKKAHPYEVPAYHLIPVLTVGRTSYGKE